MEEIMYFDALHDAAFEFIKALKERISDDPQDTEEADFRRNLQNLSKKNDEIENEFSQLDYHCYQKGSYDPASVTEHVNSLYTDLKYIRRDIREFGIRGLPDFEPVEHAFNKLTAALSSRKKQASDQPS